MNENLLNLYKINATVCIYNTWCSPVENFVVKNNLAYVLLVYSWWWIVGWVS